MKFNQTYLLAMVLSMASSTVQTFAQTTNSAPVRLPDVIVTGDSATSELTEERVVGSNQQPEWTTHRRFSTTRVYVLAPGEFEVEQWMKYKNMRGGGTEQLLQSEIGIGLPHRFQIDL